MITIINRLRKISIDAKKIEQKIKKMLDYLDYGDFDIGVFFTTNATIKKYNNQYRKKNKATDILSFPFHTELKAGEKPQILSTEDKNLGDIIISLEYAKKDATCEKRSLEQRLDVLLAHGICHLLGYDHKENDDYKKMHIKENELLSHLDLKGSS